MVRVKIACKDPTRIPRKSLFEMNNNFYLIQFKVEKSTTPGDGDDKDGKGDEEDFDNGDDAGMEELHHDPVTEGKKNLLGIVVRANLTWGRMLVVH
jgi:hypothetical protein